MSVLSFPRIYFKGYMEWDPCTFNNNDWPKKFSTYDATNAALNWEALKPFGINQDNFTTTFRPWAICLQEDLADTPPVGERVPCEWNMFGSHSVKFVQYQNPGGSMYTTIIGGDVGYNNPARSDDPILGDTVAILGDGGSGGGALVDTNPTSPWSSQVYFGQFQFGDSPNTTTGQRVYRMHSRWLNPNRIYTQDPVTPITSPASSIGVCFQTCMPYNQVSWPANSTSKLLNELKIAAAQPGALGIMIRFTAYVNLYFMNGIFNGASQQPRTYAELADALATAWNTWNTSGSTSDFFSNPCYSHVVGVIGVWNNGELASVPGGRCLNLPPPPASSAAPQPLEFAGHELKTTAPPSPVLGPAAVNVDYSSSLISLDFSGAVPENGTPGSWPSDLTKADCGPLTLGVLTTNPPFTPIAVIDYAQYQQSAYEAKAGIIDIPFPNSGAGSLLQNNPIAIQMQGQTALQEQTYTAETDTRGIYLDQNETAKFDVTVCQQGIPTKGVKLLVAKYDSGLNLIPSTSTQYVNITNGVQVTVPVPGSSPAAVSNAAIFDTDPNGVATVSIASQMPGFPVLGFFPYAAGSPQPQPPASFSFIDDAFYTTIRVLPFDDAVPQQFCDAWNSQPTSQNAWNFVYYQILYVYDMLFSVMLGVINLGSQTSFDGSLCPIWNATQKEAALENTRAMPITRDMSAGKRLALQLYIYLADNDFNLGGKPLTVNSIPPGWTPCGKKAAFGNTTKT